jgi:hypothetical protein
VVTEQLSSASAAQPSAPDDAKETPPKVTEDLTRAIRIEERAERRPHVMTSAWQQILTFSALLIGLSALGASMFTILNTAATERARGNAALVRIGIEVLRVDPQKEAHVSPIREWAMRLIDASAGGVEFTDEERKQLRTQALPISSFYMTGSDYFGYADIHPERRERPRTIPGGEAPKP